MFWLPLLLPFCPVACRRLLDGPSCEEVQSVAITGRHHPVKSIQNFTEKDSMSFTVSSTGKDDPAVFAQLSQLVPAVHLPVRGT